MSVWKKIKKQDLKRLEKHAANHEPHCHLNVVDLWAYKITDNYWFECGDTIVYRLNYYSSRNLYTTLQGDKDVKKAIKKLCDTNPRIDTLTLECVPELAKKNLEKWKAVISIKEDKDNHDYIFDVAKILSFSFDKQKSKSKAIRKLLNKHPDISYRAIDANNALIKKQLYGVFDNWVSQTKATDWEREKRALKRALNMTSFNLDCIGFFDGQKMIGYTINRPEKNGYYQAYFGKADREYNALSIYQEYATAEYMQQKYGSKYMNLQPDSGIAGLRTYKNSLGPSRKLMKYIVKIDTSKID